MKSGLDKIHVAYLAPSFPAVSSTFVQDELRELERRGIAVLPVTVRRPPDPAADEAALAARTVCLYEGPRWRQVVDGLAALPRFRAGATTALGWLAADIAAIGWWRVSAWKLAFQFLAAARLATLLRARRVTHLHVHFIHVPTQIAMYASAMTAIPFTVTAHANDLFEHGLLLARKAARARRVLAISSFNRNHLIAAGVDPERVVVVRCAPRLSPPSARAIKAPGATLRFGTLGRLIEKKGVDVLIDAFADLVAGGIDATLEIAGDGPLRATLEAQAKGVGIAGRVRFFGALAHTDVAAWMRDLDVLVLACKPDRNGDMDGIPVVLMEAMSLGVPVVATRLSGIPELVVHERTGLKAEAGNATGLARQLRRLADDPELRQRLAANATEHVRQEFSSELNIGRLLAQIAVPIDPGVAPSPIGDWRVGS